MTETQKFAPLTDDEKVAMLDPELIPGLKTDTEQLVNETSAMVHEFTHIGDSREHDPLRVKIGFEVIDRARESMAGILRAARHPETPEDLREAEYTIIHALALAGQVALDLRVATINWEALKLKDTLTSGGAQNPLIALINLQDMNRPEDEKN